MNAALVLRSILVLVDKRSYELLQRALVAPAALVGTGGLRDLRERCFTVKWGECDLSLHMSSGYQATRSRWTIPHRFYIHLNCFVDVYKDRAFGSELGSLHQRDSFSNYVAFFWLAILIATRAVAKEYCHGSLPVSGGGFSSIVSLPGTPRLFHRSWNCSGIQNYYH